MSSAAIPEVAPDWKRAAPRSPLLVVTALLLALLVLSLILSPEDLGISGSELLSAFLDRIPGLRSLSHEAVDNAASQIMWEIRAPRALTAALIGALLAYAGVAFQGLLMNPLAEPYTVGVSAGAAVGASLVQIAGFSALFGGYAGVGAAFLGGLGAIALVYALASVQGRVAVHAFLLAGVVVGTLLWSLIPLMLFVAGRSDQMASVMFFIIGSVSSAGWNHVYLLIPFLVAVALIMRYSGRELNLMAMGEEAAAHLGVETELFKRRVLLIGSLATAACVSVGGIIGFVGLVVPHLARRIVGPDHRSLLPLAAVMGASLLVAADLIGRVYLDEMPVGVITSLVGAPVFCILLRRTQRSSG
jgi:iron complex transport system permease protein